MAKEPKAIDGPPTGTPTVKSYTYDKSNGKVKMTAKVAVSSNHTSDQNSKRGTHFRWWWQVLTRFVKKNSKGETGKVKSLAFEDRKSIKTSQITQSINRDDYYPSVYKKRVIKKDKNGKTISDRFVMQRGSRLSNFQFGIMERNDFNNGSVGPLKLKNHVFKKPNKPTVSFEYTDEHNVVVTIKAPKSGAARERYDVVYDIYRKDKKTGTAYEGKWVQLDSSGYYKDLTKQPKTTNTKYRKGFTGGSHNFTHGISNHELTPSQSIQIKVVCYARGLWGDGDKVTKTYTIEGPRVAVIDKIEVTGAKSKNDGKTKYRILGQVLVYYEGEGKGDRVDSTSTPTEVILRRAVTPEYIDTWKKAQEFGDWSGEIDKNNGVMEDSKKNKDRKKAGVLGEPVTDVFAAMTDHDGYHYGERVWYMLETKRQDITYQSNPVEATDFYVPTPSMAKDFSQFLAIAAGQDGTSIDFTVAWDNKDVKDEMVDEYPNGKFTTEVSWGTDERQWQSNKKADTMDIDWENDATRHAEAVANDINKGTDEEKRWKKSADGTIMDLTTGGEYYLKTRRHVTLDDIDDYGPYTSAPAGFWPFILTSTASSLEINTPSFLEYGQPLVVGWNHDGVDAQTNWCVYIGTSASPTKLVAPTESETGYSPTADMVSIPFETIADALEKYTVEDWEDVILYVVVGVSIDGGQSMIRSDEVINEDGDLNHKTVTVVKAPDCAVISETTPGSQPISFIAFTNDADSSLLSSVRTRREAELELPDKAWVQPEGEYLWTDMEESSQWNETSSLTEDAIEALADPTHGLAVADVEALVAAYSFYQTVALPEGLDIWDGCDYYVEATTANAQFPRLVSETVEFDFTPDYDHKAGIPGELSYAEDRYYGKYQTPYVKLSIARPTNIVAGDVCDIYRYTADGADLVAEDVEFDSTIIDMFPPFSKRARTRYALVTRTPDGSRAVREIRYSLLRSGLRFDWGTGRSRQFLDLPYNVKLSDSFTKDVRIQDHLDGSTSAYFNESVNRSGSLSAVEPYTLEHVTPEQFEKLRELAQYPGTVLVRGYDGTCYEANVDVSGIEVSYDNLTAPISFTTRQVELSENFKINKDEEVAIGASGTEEETEHEDDQG